MVAFNFNSHHKPGSRYSTKLNMSLSTHIENQKIWVFELKCYAYRRVPRERRKHKPSPHLLFEPTIFNSTLKESLYKIRCSSCMYPKMETSSDRRSTQRIPDLKVVSSFIVARSQAARAAFSEDAATHASNDCC